MPAEPPGFREYVETRSPALLRTAWMLTGNSATAEDLLQTALARTWPHWNRVATGNPDAYVRTVMVRLDARWRSRFWNGERPTAAPGDHVDPGRMLAADEHRRVDDRAVLVAALAQLPVRQRQVVVLRYFDDLPVETVADIMGSSAGTVKSQSSRALTKLRAALGPMLVDQEET